MWGKLALLAAGTLMGYLGKKIYDENQNSAPKSQDVPGDCHHEDKRDNQETAVIPEAAAIPEPVIITESAAAAALKHIYENNGPGKLDWDVSADGQVIAKDGRVEAHDGALISLNLDYADLRGILKLHDLESLSSLRADVCNLEGIDFKNLPSLKKLSLSHNYIVDISSLEDLKSLTMLNLNWQNGQSCEKGKLKNLSPLAGLTNLTKLAACGNKIHDLSPLADLSALTELDVSSNYVHNLSPLAGLTNVNELNLRHNNITDIHPLSGLTRLSKLKIDHNMISDFSRLGELQKLVSEEAFKNQRIKRGAILVKLSAERKKEISEREIGKCPHCERIIRYPDIEDWEAHERTVIYIGSRIYMYTSTVPVYVKSGNCPDCGHLITLQGLFYNWKITGPNDPVSAALHKISGSLS